MPASTGSLPKNAGFIPWYDQMPEKSADDVCNAVETLTPTVSALHGIGFGKIHPLGYPAFRAVRK
jgi:hypothetical protein